MSQDIKYLELENGKKYPFIYTLNVIEDIQNKYGSIEKWSNQVERKDGEPDIGALKYFFMIAINEGIDIENEDKKDEDKVAFVTDKQVGRIISEIGLKAMTEKLTEAVVDASATDNTESLTGDTEKN